MVKKKKTKKDIPEPTELEVLVRNKKKYDDLISHYRVELKRLKLAIRVYKKKRRVLEDEIKTLTRGEGTEEENPQRN